MAFLFSPKVRHLQCRQQSVWTKRSLDLLKYPHRSNLSEQQRQLYARDYRDRLFAITEIFKLGEAGIPLLVEALRDPHQRVRQLAAKCLSIFPNHPTVQSLLTAANYRNLRCQKTIKQQPQAITTLAVSPNDQYVLSANGTNCISLWDVVTGKLVRHFWSKASGISQAIFNHDGCYILSNHADPQICMWHVATGKLVHQLSGHTERVHTLALVPTEHQLISGSWDGTIGLWDLNTGQRLRQFVGHHSPIYAVVVHGNWVFSTDGNGTIHRWHRQTGRTEQIYQLEKTTVQTLASHPTEPILYSGDRQSRLSVWNYHTGEHVDTMAAWTYRATHQVMFSPDGNVIFQTCGHGINLWHHATGWLIHQLTGHRWATTALAITSDGQTLISGSDDQCIKFWQL